MILFADSLIDGFLSSNLMGKALVVAQLLGSVVMFATIILLIIIVQLFQMIGNWATKRSDKRVF